jgi:hypothetical protein
MERKKEPKMFWGIDISKWGQAITVFISVAAILISLGGAKYQISDARADIKDINSDKNIIKQDFDDFKGQMEKRFDSLQAVRTEDLLEDKEMEVIIGQHVLPTLERIDRNVIRLEEKMDQHLYNSQVSKK